MIYDSKQFADTVMNDYARRTESRLAHESTGSVIASAGVETRALGHPLFEPLHVGQRSATDLVAVFLDLSDFTSRSFWDDSLQVADLAHSILTGFVEVVSQFGGHPLGLRGDGLFAGFGPGTPAVDCSMALGACAFALNAVEAEVNPRLELRGIEPVKARAGLDFGRITFVRTGSEERNEVNPIGFAANFAAKCEKIAGPWEIVAGQGVADNLQSTSVLRPHPKSPKSYTRGYKTEYYKYFDYSWRTALPHLAGAAHQLGGRPTSAIKIS